MTVAYLTSLLQNLRLLVALSFLDYWFVHARGPLITQAPRLDDRLLIARGGVSTCGFVSGDVNSPLTCPTSFSCTSTVQDLVGWACCDQIQCVANWRTCVDYGAQLCELNDPGECSSIYTSILSCSAAAPYCFSYARSLSLGAESTEFSLACGQTSTVVLALQTALSGNSPAKGTAASLTAPGQSSPSSPDTSSSSGLSAGAKAGIAVPVASLIVACTAILVGIMVGWWKKHQVLYFITCGQRGYKKSVKPQTVQGAHPLADMGNGATHNGGGNYATNVRRWGVSGRS